MTTTPVLVLGTANRKKGRELADLFSKVGVELRTLADFPQMTTVPEDASTFAENAILKAVGYARQTGHWVLADDSGLLVDVLKGEPGVFSARYAGPEATDLQNCQRLLEKLGDLPLEKRSAGFVCRIAVADPQGNVRLETEASCRGRILFSPRGNHGFGYDPLFEVPEYHRTFAELGPVVKACLSHRARAVRQVLPHLIRWIDLGEWKTS